MLKLLLAGAAIGLCAAATPGMADILGTGSRSGNYSSGTTSTWVTVPINGTFTSDTFSTSAANQIVRVTYNAECGALGATGNWLGLQILIDGVAMAPQSGASFAFCTAASTTSYLWTGAVRQSTLKVPHSGTHKVTVQAYGAGTTQWWLGDSSIVIDK